jgi:hypothetical protein
LEVEKVGGDWAVRVGEVVVVGHKRDEAEELAMEIAAGLGRVDRRRTGNEEGIDYGSDGAGWVVSGGVVVGEGV